MSELVRFIVIAAVAAIGFTLALRLLKATLKTVLGFFLNAAFGVGAVFLLNLIPGISIPLAWWTALVAGVFGIPGIAAVAIIGFFL